MKPNRMRANPESSNNNASLRGQPPVFLRWSLGALLGVLLVATTTLAFAQLRQTFICGMSGSQSSPGPKVSLRQYMRMGQWRADARTLFAEARYLLEWESGDMPVK